MPTHPGPYNLQTQRPVFKPNNLAQVLDVTQSFYQDLDQKFDSFADHILVQQFSFGEAWPTWEIHPKGDEMVYLLEGDTDLVLWIDGAEQVVRVNEPGGYVIVPCNTWHTARPHTQTTMLFITPGEGTLNADHPE
ncbi:MAG: cupin domain-containing protein [Pseudomonadales bacterium]|nr:cupin domain-containing protein [Pseudomonadales bacterium]